MAESLYRKYRPQVFEDVVGQENITRTLRNAVRENRVSHAYLFCGPRGTGKTTTARLLAKALLCEHGPTDTPCGTCQACVDIANGVHPDVYELDAASRTGVDNVRDEIISRVNFAPTRGRKKIYIIDEVHMLSTAAFNALLKTLEEPPEHVVFILCTTDPQKVPPTIQSRCQRFDFHRISDDEIVQRLGYVCAKEKIEYEAEALGLIAQHAQGGMRNALTALEQLSAFGEGRVTLAGAESMLGSVSTADMSEIMQAIGSGDVAACFTWVADYVEKGADLAQFAQDLAWHVRNAYVLSLAGTDATVDIDDAERSEIVEELKVFGPDRLSRLLGVLGDLIAQLKTSTNPRLCFEIALTRMVRPEGDLTLASLAQRIEALERGQAVRPQARPSTRAVPAQSQPPAEPAPVQAQTQVQTPTPTPVANTIPSRSAPTPVPTTTQTAQAPSNAPSAAPQSTMPQNPPHVSPASASPSTAAQAPAPQSQGQQAQSRQSQATPEQRAVLQKTIGNPAALQRAWQEVLAQVKKRKIPLSVMFIGVKVLSNQNADGIVFQFPPNAVIAMNAVQNNEENQRILQEELTKRFGEGVTFTCSNGTAAGASPTSSNVRQAPPQSNPAPAPMPNANPQTPVRLMPTARPQTSVRPMPNVQAQTPPAPPSARPQSQASYRAQPQAQQPQAQPRMQGQAPASHTPASAPNSEPGGHQEPANTSNASDTPRTAEEMGQMLSDAMGANIVFHEVTDDRHGQSSHRI